MGFVYNLLLFPTVKEFWKSVRFWQSYRHQLGGPLFGTQSIYDKYVLLNLVAVVLSLAIFKEHAAYRSRTFQVDAKAEKFKNWFQAFLKHILNLCKKHSTYHWQKHSQFHQVSYCRRKVLCRLHLKWSLPAEMKHSKSSRSINCFIN